MTEIKWPVGATCTWSRIERGRMDSEKWCTTGTYGTREIHTGALNTRNRTVQGHHVHSALWVIDGAWLSGDRGLAAEDTENAGDSWDMQQC